jgi:protein-S-isoprenylcysteine O-methyltransferase Ste14
MSDAAAPEPRDPNDSAGVRLPPPFVYMAAIALGFVVHWIWPVPVRPPGWWGFGAVLVVCGVALVLWAVVTLRRAKTQIAPWMPTTAIVTNGPFAQTRNPMYFGMALIQLGIGQWTNRLAIVLLVIPAIFAINSLAIAKEETYLLRKFGDEYRKYTQRVRRWL